MTTDKQELQRLCDSASPGPWEPNEYGVGEFWVSSAQYDEAGEDVSVAVCILDSDIRYRVAGMDQQQTDMQFIAAARTAIPELLAELAAVTAERDGLLATATLVTDGWKLVPVEPTDEMLRCAQKEWLADPLRRSTTLYRAMLNAAPPKEQGYDHT